MCEIPSFGLMCPAHRENTKKETGRERKAAAVAQRALKVAEKKEAQEAISWQQGAKDTSKAKVAEQKRLEKLAHKAEIRALEVHEQELLASTVTKRHLPNAAPVLSSTLVSVDAFATAPLFSANGGTQGHMPKIEKHPEKRIKSAYAEYEEAQMAVLKEENPTLRHSQLRQTISRNWKKAPENPLNQQYLAHNATRDQEAEMISKLSLGT